MKTNLWRTTALTCALLISLACAIPLGGNTPTTAQPTKAAPTLPKPTSAPPNSVPTAANLPTTAPLYPTATAKLPVPPTPTLTPRSIPPTPTPTLLVLDAIILPKPNVSKWGTWQSIGGQIVGAPAVASWGPNRLDVFGRGTDNHLWWNYWDGNQWSGWQDLGGDLASSPAAVSWKEGRIDVFVYGILDGHLWHRFYTSTQGWSEGWEDLGAFLTSTGHGLELGVASWKPFRLDVFSNGNHIEGDRTSTDVRAGPLWHTYWEYGWGPWDNWGGEIISGPSAVSWGPNRIDIVAIGKDGRVWHRVWDGKSLPWVRLSEKVINGAPAISSWGPGRLDVFGRGTDNALWHAYGDGVGWSSWESLGGNITSSPAAVSWGPGRIDIFARGGDGAVWQIWWQE